LYTSFKSKKNISKTRLLISLFETNYIKYKELFSENSIKKDLSFFLPEGTFKSEVSIVIKSLSQHTDLLQIKHGHFSTFGLRDSNIEVAIYHDAKMAEVIKFNGKKQIWLLNKYPNLKMLSKDEKFQWNLYLAEWLSFSKKEGLSSQELKITY
tara:strand:- start:9328 stop:9786 length:459 start_codon:yes stop_codon:yes gene_type:complete